MADAGTSDACAAVGGGESREANLNVEGGSDILFLTSGVETSDAAEPAAAEIADGGTGTADASTSMPSSSSLLPAALVGSILNFMPYKEVRTALLAGKFMASVVSKQVNAHNILRSSELVPVAKVLVVLAKNKTSQRRLTVIDRSQKRHVGVCNVPWPRRVDV